MNEFPFGYTKKVYRDGIVVHAEVYTPQGKQLCNKWYYNGFTPDWWVRRYFRLAHKWCDKQIRTAHEFTV